MKLKKILMIIGLGAIISSCVNMDIPPINIVSESDIFSSNEGITSNLARIYSRLPIEDFKYHYPTGFNYSGTQYKQMACLTGEAVGRDTQGADNEGFSYWDEAYSGIRDINMILEKVPQYSASLKQADVNTYLAEAHFARAYTYFSLV